MGFPVNGITHFALLCLWLLDPTQSCRDSSCITDSFFLVTKRYALWGVRACSTIRLPVDSQSISSFGWPRKDSVIICVQVFWGTYALISLGSNVCRECLSSVHSEAKNNVDGQIMQS